MDQFLTQAVNSDQASPELEQEVKEKDKVFPAFRLGADKCQQMRHFSRKQEFHLCVTTKSPTLHQSPPIFYDKTNILLAKRPSFRS